MYVHERVDEDALIETRRTEKRQKNVKTSLNRTTTNTARRNK